MRRFRLYLGTLARLAAILAVLAALIAVPLVTVHRSKCERGTTRYSFVPPWEDPPAECRDHQSGLEMIQSELGL